jgi:hypothetical protein
MRLAFIPMVLAAGMAAAQTAPSNSVSDLNQDTSAMAVAQKHMLQDMEKVVAELNALREENAKLKACAPSGGKSP